MSLQERISFLAYRVSREFASLRGTSGHARRFQPWHLSLASQNTAPANIYVMGDSVLEGAVSSALTERAISVLEKSLRDRPGGAGYFPAHVVSPFVPNPATFSHTPVALGTTGEPPVQFDQVWTSHGFGAKRIGLQKNGWVEWTFTGDRVRVWHDRTTFFGRSANVYIDGSFVVKLDGGGADEGAVSWLSDELGHGSHTIRVQESDNLGGAFWVEGVEPLAGDADSGVHLYDGARSGARSEDYTSPSCPWPDAMAKVTPSLVLMMFGFNDMNQRTPAQFKVDLQKVVDRIRAKLVEGTYTLAIVAPWSPNPAPAAGWNAYVTVMEEVAVAHPYGVSIRIIDRWPLMVAGGSNPGMFAQDTIHPSEQGQRLLGTYLADALALPRRLPTTTPVKVYSDVVEISVSGSVNGNATLTFPPKFFNPAGPRPVVSVTPIGQLYAATTGTPSTSSVVIAVRHVQNTSSTATVRVQVVAIQNSQD